LSIDATLFALLYAVLFGAVVRLLLAGLWRSALRKWARSLVAIIGSVIIWGYLLFFLDVLGRFGLELTNLGHAGSSFLLPYLALSFVVIVAAPILAYRERMPGRPASFWPPYR
jgi:hypothetical protein